jgi:hypothetical protein
MKKLLFRTLIVSFLFQRGPFLARRQELVFKREDAEGEGGA